MTQPKYSPGWVAMSCLLVACTRGGSETQASPDEQGANTPGSPAAFDAAPPAPAQAQVASILHPEVASEVEKECKAICQRSVDLKCKSCERLHGQLRLSSQVRSELPQGFSVQGKPPSHDPRAPYEWSP